MLSRARLLAPAALAAALAVTAVGATTAAAAPDVTVSFSGSVVRADGVAVADAEVDVIAMPDAIGKNPRVLAETTASASGTYTVDATVAPGTGLLVRASLPSTTASNAVAEHFAETAYVGAGTTPDVGGDAVPAYPMASPISASTSSVTADVTLAELGALSITSPAHGDDVRIEVERRDGSRVEGVGVGSFSSTMRTVTGLYPGDYQVVAVRLDPLTGHSTWSTPVPTTVTAGTTTTASVAPLPAVPTASISGTVTRHGKPQRKVAVNVYDAGGTTGCVWTGDVTDRHGRYHIDVPQGGSWTVRFASTAYDGEDGVFGSRYVGRDRRVTVADGSSTTVNAKVKRGGKVKGHVKVGKKVRSVSVEVVAKHQHVVAVKTLKVTKKQHGKRRFAFTGLRKGTYHVIAQALDGKHRYAKVKAKVRLHRTTKVGTLKVHKKGVTLKGRLARHKRGTVELTRVACGQADDNSWSGDASLGLTAVKKSGKFRVKHVVPGRYYLFSEQGRYLQPGNRSVDGARAYYADNVKIRVRKHHRRRVRITKRARLLITTIHGGSATLDGDPVVSYRVRIDDQVLGAGRRGTLGGYFYRGGRDDGGNPYEHSLVFDEDHEFVTLPTNGPYYYPIVSPTKVTKRSVRHIVLGPLTGA